MKETQANDERRVEIGLESSTMVLYVSVVLLAALVALDTSADIISDTELLGLIWGTTLGLALAHYFAFRVSRQRRYLPIRRTLGGAPGHFSSRDATLPFDVRVQASGIFVAKCRRKDAGRGNPFGNPSRDTQWNLVDLEDAATFVELHERDCADHQDAQGPTYKAEVGGSSPSTPTGRCHIYNVCPGHGVFRVSGRSNQFVASFKPRLQTQPAAVSNTRRVREMPIGAAPSAV
jgi:hypothetical protein